MLIFVDVDSVVADLMPEWLKRYNHDYSDNLTVDQIENWTLVENVKPECGVKIFDYLEDPSLYDYVKRIDGAVMACRELRDMGHRIIFATSTPNGSAGRKLRWLIDNEFLSKKDMKGTTHPDYIELNDKSLLRGDVLIDDAPHNVESFKGLSILFRQHHNRNFRWNLCANGWSEVINILMEDDLPPGNHPTEIRCPIQANAFKKITEDMYRVHLEKNADYSPANILGTGFVGLVTRLWDKTARLMNLSGFRIEISKSSFDAPKTPKNESIDDTLLDLSVYSIIGKLLREGKWGR